MKIKYSIIKISILIIFLFLSSFLSAQSNLINRIKSQKKDSIANYNDEKIIHYVQPGDTYYSISRTYGCSVEDLKKWNHKTSENLNTGELLYIYSEENYVANEKLNHSIQRYSESEVTTSKTDKFSSDSNIVKFIPELQNAYKIDKKNIDSIKMMLIITNFDYFLYTNYDTPLKRKVFLNSEEAKVKYSELNKNYYKIINSTYYCICPINKLKNGNSIRNDNVYEYNFNSIQYDLKLKGFVLQDDSHYKGFRFFSEIWFALPNYMIKSRKEDSGIPNVNISKTHKISITPTFIDVYTAFVPISNEKEALEIEENIKDISVIFVFYIFGLDLNDINDITIKSLQYNIEGKNGFFDYPMLALVSDVYLVNNKTGKIYNVDKTRNKQKQITKNKK